MRPVIDQTIDRNLIWETGAYVKAIRLRHGLTARAFGAELGMGPASIYRVEADVGGVTVKTLRRILEWHNTHPLPRPCTVSHCWLGKGHEGPHEDHS